MVTEHGTDQRHRIPPPEEFVDQANVSDPSIYDAFDERWPDCWERATSLLSWDRPYTEILERIEQPPYRRWFSDGTLNACYNCVDRHVEAGRGDEPALRWVRETGDRRTYTYADLEREVNAVAAVLRDLGVSAGDPVGVYMPRLPELPITMLAAARLGAPHMVVFAEYSPSMVASFIRETGVETLVTADGYSRNGEFRDLASSAENAIESVDHDVTVVSTTRTDEPDTDTVGLDFDALRAASRGRTVEPVTRTSTDRLFVTYASGPTGTPTGMTHLIGSYLSYVAWTTYAVLDVKPKDTLWCPAGIEWITGHSYVVYGPLVLGATTILYEGASDYPDPHRPWEIIENNDVNQFYTTPTAIRTFMDWGGEYPTAHDRSSLRLLGTVGQRIEPETWRWFYEHVGNERCPIVDTWYQAETGGITLSTLPGICAMKPGSVGPPLPGIDVAVVDAIGDPVESGDAGYLTFERPWPGFFRPVGSTDQAERYWTEFGHPDDRWIYFAKDGALRDEEYITVLGRLDDIINIGYHSKNRVHTSEIERTILDLEAVEDVAVVCGTHEIKGEAPYAFVVPVDRSSSDIHETIAETVRLDLAAQACPEACYLVPELPRTYSGSVLRQVLTDLLDGEYLGDTDMLRNPGVLDHIAVEIRQNHSSTR
ncbi:acetyl-coenzyme A synthetase [Natrarchaeobius halalkaliphilus]|uniref:acetate--CoA ligase n=1 Tax=Natrarchaeobius halalkaliphilus TaxID=1679091 RepID=A0A3N6MRA0_9EURY|nr:AMP-binding protein [Natrarchaeobius halalkaliphilus]RQG86783.1 acetyl-coenzyme A synthetase [Natrarchaeobius halalkaliphilus]